MVSDKKIKPSILPGFMELLPPEQLVFNGMLNKIQKSFELYGFLPLDTPIIEKAEILLAKGGGETEKQTYYFKKGDSDLALRYDLTVPLARYVSEHINNLNFPFKRYQIGKSYRGEKPQKGRFREFYQCDIDIVGKDNLSLINDAEILATIYFTFNELNLGKYQIRLNNRKILFGYAAELDLGENTAETIRIIDKKEKMGKERFLQEITEVGLTEPQKIKLISLLELKGNSDAILSVLEKLNVKNEQFILGLKELREVTEYIKSMEIPEEYWKIDLNIARGLDYYTGTVYETYLLDQPQLGSICSGGRYDNLADYFTDQKLPGVGISIGLTRLFSQLKELGQLPKYSATTAKILIVAMEGFENKAFTIASLLRLGLVPTEIYTGNATDIKKKLDYANKTQVPFVGIIGENEVKDSSVMVKDMETGEQKSVKTETLVAYVQKKLQK
jgi:histidyl-tRNA synthetase